MKRKQFTIPEITITMPHFNAALNWSFVRKWLLPNPGTLILMVILALAMPAIAGPSNAPSATSISTIPYQGRLADASGNPITAKQNMEFRVYDVPTGGAPSWEEFWTGGNSVNVSDGLFSVMLGSINTGLASVVQGYDELYLGITIGTDSEMEPRVQLGSVPFSMWSMTVADDSITEEKIADNAVGSSEIISGSVTTAEIADDSITGEKIADNAVGSSEITNESVTTAEIADGAVTSRKIAPSWYEDYSPSKISTTSTDFISTGVSVTFTCETDCTALILHRSLVQHSSVDGRVDVKVLVDGTLAFYELGIVNKASPPGSGSNTFQSVEGFDFVNLSAGIHTVDVEFKCYIAGTCYYYGDSDGKWEHLNVLVFAQP